MRGTQAEIRKAQDKAVEMKLAGKGWKEIWEKTQLTHSQADLAWYRYQAQQNGTYIPEKFQAMTEEDQARWILEQRINGVSWGVMHASTDVPESRLRTIFEKNHKVASEGLRIGKGGRWLAAEPRYYLGNNKGIGVEFDPDNGRPDPNKVAERSEKAKSVLPTKLNGKQRRQARQAAAKAEAKKVEANA